MNNAPEKPKVKCKKCNDRGHIVKGRGSKKVTTPCECAKKSITMLDIARAFGYKGN